MSNKSLMLILVILFLIFGGIWAFYYYVSTINSSKLIEPTSVNTPLLATQVQADPKLAINEGITDLVQEGINYYCSPTSIKGNKIELVGSKIKITGTNNQIYTVTYSENAPLIRLIRSVYGGSYVDEKVLTPRDIPAITNATGVCFELVSLNSKNDFNFSDIKGIVIY